MGKYVTNQDVYDEMFAVMITGKDETGEWNVAALQKGFTVTDRGFSVHGDDKEGRWDIEFPTMFEAVEWYRVWRESIAEFNIRSGDNVTDLNSVVVMTMMPKHKL